MQTAIKVVYASLELYSYELNDRAKFFLIYQILRCLGMNIRILGTLAKNTDIAIILACKLQ